MNKDGDLLPAIPTYAASVATPAVYSVRNVDSQESDILTPAEIFRRTRRHAVALVVCALAGLSLGWIAAVLQHPTYRARTVIEIDAPNQNYLNLRAADPTAEDYAEPFLQTQIKKLKSESVLDGVAQQLQLSRQPEFIAGSGDEPAADRVLRILERNLNVRASGTSRLIEVTYESRDPKLAADIANALAAEFIHRMFDLRLKASQRTAEVLGAQLQELKTNLERAENELFQYAAKAGLTQAQTLESGSLAEEKLRRLQETLSKAEEARIAQYSLYDRVKSSPTDALPEVLDNDTVRNYQVKLTDLRRQAAELRTLVTPEHYKLRQTVAQIAELEAALERERANVLGRMKNDYEAAQQREKLLAQDYAKQTGVVTSQAGQLARYSMLKREVDTNRQVYEATLQRVKEVGIASEIPTSYVQVIDPAKIPARPSKPSFPLYAGVGLIAGSLLGLGCVFLRFREDTVMAAPGDVSLHVRLPELGAIPNAEDVEDERSRWYRELNCGRSRQREMALISWQETGSIVAESFRAALASVLFTRQNGQRPRIVVITSACPGEGKTVVASNFAIGLAKTNHKVLLVDGDMRRPKMHKVFGVQNARGLSDLLSETKPCTEYETRDFAVPTEVPGLYVLPSGATTAIAPDLLYSVRAAKLLDRLRQEFDSILIDTPPLFLADARALGKLADGVILVVRADQTSASIAVDALRRLSDDGTCVLGTILNNWNPKKTSMYRYGQPYMSYSAPMS